MLKLDHESTAERDPCRRPLAYQNLFNIFVTSYKKSKKKTVTIILKGTIVTVILEI